MGRLREKPRVVNVDGPPLVPVVLEPHGVQTISNTRKFTESIDTSSAMSKWGWSKSAGC
jgi:hypothetical protein